MAYPPAAAACRMRSVRLFVWSTGMVKIVDENGDGVELRDERQSEGLKTRRTDNLSCFLVCCNNSADSVRAHDIRNFNFESPAS